jgi:hypothetical protein
MENCRVCGGSAKYYNDIKHRCKEYIVNWQHLISDKTGTSNHRFMTEMDLLKAINKWNQDDRWKYWI